jgi:hypothetical protein
VNVDRLHYVPANLFRLRLSRMHFSAIAALPQFRVLVEPFKHRRQIAHDTFQIQFRAMHQMIAFWAVPLDSVHGALGTRRFDYQADASRGALRRMAHVFRQMRRTMSPFNW